MKAFLAGVLILLSATLGCKRDQKRAPNKPEEIPILINGVTVQDPAKSLPVPFPKDAPPARIKVGPYHYRIEFRADKDMTNALGLTDETAQVIYLNISMGPDQLRATVLHELIHAATWASGNRGKSRSDDDFIDGATGPLLETLQDNPKLLNWLLYAQH